MKKIITILLAVLMIMSLWACDPANEPDSSSKAPESSEPVNSEKDTEKDTEKETEKETERD